MIIEFIAAWLVTKNWKLSLVYSVASFLLALVIAAIIPFDYWGIVIGFLMGLIIFKNWKMVLFIMGIEILLTLLLILVLGVTLLGLIGM